MIQTYYCYYSTPNDLISSFMGQVVEKGFNAKSDFELVFFMPIKRDRAIKF